MRAWENELQHFYVGFVSTHTQMVFFFFLLLVPTQIICRTVLTSAHLQCNRTIKGGNEKRTKNLIGIATIRCHFIHALNIQSNNDAWIEWNWVKREKKKKEKQQNSAFKWRSASQMIKTYFGKIIFVCKYGRKWFVSIFRFYSQYLNGCK